MLETKGTLTSSSDDPSTTLPTLSTDDDDADDTDTKIDKPVLWELPHPRFNAQLAVQDDTLYIYGGTFEKGDREFTFDELYAIDLGKLDGAKEVFRRELEDWMGSDDEDDDDEDDDGEGSDEGFESADDEDSNEAEKTASTAPSSVAVAADAKEAQEQTTEDEAAVKDDGLPHPRPFESLREFFTRSSNAWQDVILEENKFKRDVVYGGVKEIRKEAFERAERTWWDDREEVQRLEDEAEEAGIGEVVSMADRGGEGGGGTGARRR